MMPTGGSAIVDFTEYIAERTRGFSGRGWLFDAVAEWLSDRDSGRSLLLIGEPGAGKTAVAAALAQLSAGQMTYPCLNPGFLSALHFCSVRDRRWINPVTFSQSVAGQLSSRYADFADALLQVVAPTIDIHLKAGQNLGTMIGAQIDTIVVSATAEDVFDRLVRAPLEACARSDPERPITILVDALD